MPDVKKVVLQGKIIQWKGRVVSASIPFQTYEFKGRAGRSPFVTDCVPLRLASHGQTKLEAAFSMRKMIKAFLDELTRMGTLDAFLRERGWSRESVRVAQRSAGRERRGDVVWVPPQVVSQLAALSLQQWTRRSCADTLLHGDAGSIGRKSMVSRCGFAKG